MTETEADEAYAKLGRWLMTEATDLDDEFEVGSDVSGICVVSKAETLGIITFDPTEEIFSFAPGAEPERKTDEYSG